MRNDHKMYFDGHYCDNEEASLQLFIGEQVQMQDQKEPAKEGEEKID